MGGYRILYRDFILIGQALIFAVALAILAGCAGNKSDTKASALYCFGLCAQMDGHRAVMVPKPEPVIEWREYKPD